MVTFVSLGFRLGKKSDTRPPQSELRSSSSPCTTLLTRGAMRIKRDIAIQTKNLRVYRMNLSRVGPCVRPQSSYMSVGLSLLSKGLRGGKSRSDRVESLLRRMIASEDAKNPLQARKQRSYPRIWLAISARKKGIVEWNQGSLRRHKCNVRRNRNLESPVHIGQMIPPLERVERRDVTK